RLAETLVGLAAEDGGQESLGALVVRCQGVVAPAAAALAGWPAAYATAVHLPAAPTWHRDDLAALAAPAPAPVTVTERAAARLAPQPPVTSQGRGNAERRPVEVRVTRDEGRGTRDEGSGIRDQGSGVRDQGSGTPEQALVAQTSNLKPQTSNLKPQTSP